MIKLETVIKTDTNTYTIGDIVEIKTINKETYKGRITHLVPLNNWLYLDCSSQYNKYEQAVNVENIKSIRGI